MMEVPEEGVSLEALVKELKEVREELHPIVRDFKSLLAGKPLGENRWYIYLSSLAKELKSEVMRDVFSKLHEPLETINLHTSALEEIKTTHEDFEVQMSSRISDLKDAQEQLQVEKAQITEHIEKIELQIADMKEDISLRTTYKEFSTLINKVNGKASIEDLQILQESLKEYITIEEMEVVKTHISSLSHRLKDYAKLNDMTARFEQLKQEFDSKLENFAAADQITLLDSKLAEKFEEAKSIMKETSFKQEKVNQFLKKEIAGFYKKVDRKPWMEDIQPLQKDISQKTPLTDFHNSLEKLNPKMDDLSSQVRQFSADQREFRLVLERYDELLTDKTGKDDHKALKKVCDTLLPKDEFLRTVNSLQKKINKLKSAAADQREIIKDSNSNLNNFYENYLSFKKDIKKFYKLFHSVADLKADINSKAEKSEIYKSIDTFCKWEDFVGIKTNTELIHKQIELMASLLVESVRTMLKSSDSAAAKERNRVELFRNTNSLYTWVANSFNREKLNTTRLLVNNSFQIDSSDSILPTLKHSRNSKYFTMSKTPIMHKASVDIP